MKNLSVIFILSVIFCASCGNKNEEQKNANTNVGVETVGSPATTNPIDTGKSEETETTTIPAQDTTKAQGVTKDQEKSKAQSQKK